MGLFHTLKFIFTHPLNRPHPLQAVFHFFRWQISTRINPYPVIYPFVAESKLIIRKGMTGATGNVYTGLHEFEDMCFLLHFINEEDTFVDVGANVGSYTVLAAKVKGAKCYAFEPVSKTFADLENNIRINHIEHLVEAFNMGVGEGPSELHFTTNLDTVNHVLDETEKIDNQQYTIVKVNSLNNLLKNIPTLIKIDVEGFESKVLDGADHILGNPNLKSIIIEINNSLLRYGLKKEDVHQKLLAFNFHPYKYDPFQRLLTPLKTFTNLNTIYIRDLDIVKRRISRSERIKIKNVLL